MPEKKTGLKKDDVRAFASASTEMLFVLLLIIVIGITLSHRGELGTLFYIPEWSIVSAVICGQAIVKLTSASVGDRHVIKETIVLIISILLVCVLVPVLIILAITLTSAMISTKMAIAQAVFFLASAAAFWISSAIEYYVTHYPRAHEQGKKG
jgi:hypothetical protein